MYTKYIFQYLLCRFEALKPAVDTRKGKLQDSLHFHQFKFDADEELQWIKEHLPAASSTEYGKSLIDAQNLHKKHQVCNIIFFLYWILKFRNLFFFIIKLN